MKEDGKFEYCKEKDVNHMFVRSLQLMKFRRKDFDKN